MNELEKIVTQLYWLLSVQHRMNFLWELSIKNPRMPLEDALGRANALPPPTSTEGTK